MLWGTEVGWSSRWQGAAAERGTGGAGWPRDEQGGHEKSRMATGGARWPREERGGHAKSSVTLQSARTRSSAWLPFSCQDPTGVPPPSLQSTLGPFIRCHHPHTAFVFPPPWPPGSLPPLLLVPRAVGEPPAVSLPISLYGAWGGHGWTVETKLQQGGEASSWQHPGVAGCPPALPSSTRSQPETGWGVTNGLGGTTRQGLGGTTGHGFSGQQHCPPSQYFGTGEMSQERASGKQLVPTGDSPEEEKLRQHHEPPAEPSPSPRCPVPWQ